jgi:transposase
MANRLKMALVESILSLHGRGWSQRRIARELGVNRETVQRHVRAASEAPKPANAPIGSPVACGHSKPANAPLGSEGGFEPANPAQASTAVEAVQLGRASACQAWHAVIEGQLELGLTAQRIYQDLVTEHGFTGSYYSVRRWVRRLGQKSAPGGLPFRRLECSPGEEAQVDFGSGAPIVADGRRRRSHVFRIVLSHSRKAYSEAVYRQTTEDFIRCLENSFRHFGGVPRTLVIDNLRAAVSRADWFDPDLNPKVQAFCRHYPTVILPTRPYTPRHKGKVERGVGYVKDNGLKGRVFASLEEENRWLAEWERTVADLRIHGTTRKQVAKVFAEVERPALQALPVERFPFFHEAQRTVHRDGHVEVAKAYYSVPPEYLARQVWARWDGRVVRVFNNQMEQIAVHAQREAGRFSTAGAHLASAKISNVERGAGWLLGKIRLLGVHSARWAEAMLQARGIEGIRVLQGLSSLARHHPAEAIERACEVAVSHGAYRLRTLRLLLQRPAAKQESLPFLDDHPLIRPLTDYAQLIHQSFQREVLP